MARILKTIIFFCWLCATASFAGYTQNTEINPSTMDVKSFSDEQIKKLIAEIEKRGLTLEEAIALARVRGASQAQIDDIRRRIKVIRQGIHETSFPLTEDPDKLETLQDELSEKAKFTHEKEEEFIFGFQFFNTEGLTFTPGLNVTVSEEYVVGAGDEVIINVYGASQQTYVLEVGKNGALYIPDLGPVYIGGLTFRQVKQKVKNRLVSIYSDMKGDPPNTFTEVSLGVLKGIKVNVIGEVHVPGTYTLPATATVFNALYLAGGPGKQGSFRKIEVLRNGKTYKSIDVYKYLIDGDAKDNIQLRDQDVILVGPYLNRVILNGEFKRTGIFEAKNGEKVSDLVRFAGGFTEKAYTHRLELYRNNTRNLSFKDVAITDFAKTAVMNGDSLVAGVIASRFENRVSIEGAVYREGNYELTPGMKLSELLLRAEGIKEEAFLERGLIIRRQEDMSFKSIAFSVKEVLSGKTDVNLVREDRVSILSIFDLREARTIQIFGEVQFPGTYAYADEMLLKDLIFQAGGFKENADVLGIEVARRLNYDEAANVSQKLLHTFLFSLDRDLKFLKDDGHFKLMPYDQVYVRQAPGFRPQGTVQIQGEVKYAGIYGITRKQERISDILVRAGGLTPEAYTRGASLLRKVELSDAEHEARLKLAKQDTTFTEEDIKKIDYQIVGIQLDEILNDAGSEKDIFVEDGDQILIPPRLQTVKVSGSVLNPVALTYRNSTKLRKYISRGGGFASNAKKSKVYVLYANGTTMATKRGLFRRYPRIEPGCEIIVPSKPEIDRSGQAAKWIGLTSGFASLAASIAAIVTLTK